MVDISDLDTLAEKLNDDGFTYIVEHQERRTPDRARGYYLRKFRIDGEDPSPPDRDATKSHKYRWQQYLNGALIGKSKAAAKKRLEQLLQHEQ